MSVQIQIHPPTAECFTGTDVMPLAEPYLRARLAASVGYTGSLLPEVPRNFEIGFDSGSDMTEEESFGRMERAAVDIAADTVRINLLFNPFAWYDMAHGMTDMYDRPIVAGVVAEHQRSKSGMNELKARHIGRVAYVVFNNLHSGKPTAMSLEDIAILLHDDHSSQAYFEELQSQGVILNLREDQVRYGTFGA